MSLISENMEQTRNALVGLIEPLSYQEFNAKASDDKWSVAQICHHLVLVELSSVKVVKWGIKESKESGSDHKNLEIVLDRTKKLRAPEIVQPSEGPFEVAQIISMLQDSRDTLHKTIYEIENPNVLKEKSVRHPALGMLTLEQWVEYLPYHEQRHMQQIKEILQ